jgi:novobiocin biosynthesis protein NovU/D-mycarose 3-C-methyltransferase
MFKLHTACRACSGEKLIPVLSLGNQALANAFAKPDELHSAFYPLEVVLCPKCLLAQLSIVVPSSVLYGTYKYVTSKSQTMQDHFKALWELIKTECNPESVLEVGSNDGDFLQFAKDNDVTVACGVDPAENLVAIARERGLVTFSSVLDMETAKMVRTAMPSIDLIIARHVFCHVDDWMEFMSCVDYLSGTDTVTLIEVPHVLDLLQNHEFDTIYHEHTSYLNLIAMKALLDRTQFHLHSVQKFPIHGGAIVLLLRRNSCVIPPHKSVVQAFHDEYVDFLELWKNLSFNVKNMVWELKQLILDLNRKGKSVVGFGASAKSTVWLNMLGLTKKEIRFICDSTPQKWGCISPGTDVPIVDEGALLRELPDYAVLWSWNFCDEIVRKNKLWLDKGGQFIVPVPKLRVIGKDDAQDCGDLYLRERKA